MVVDDHQLLREGIKSLISQSPDMEVVGDAATGRAAIRRVEELRPDVVLMDIVMPDLNGMDATRQILVAAPTVRVIGLSAHAEAETLAEMFRAGAWGFLDKASAFDELLLGIRTVMAGRRFVGASLMHLVVGEFVRQAGSPPRSGCEGLTAREREVLQLLAEGCSTRAVARRLCVSIKTVETHRRSVMTKLGVTSIAALTKIAIRERLTSLDF